MKKNLLMGLALIIPLILVILGTFYFFGIRKYGTPTAYREQQQALMQAREDSLRALESLVAPENVADSTLFGMNVQSRIVSGTKEKEAQILGIQTSIDSLNRLQESLTAREQALAEREAQIQQEMNRLQDENVLKLANLYDNMKTNLAVPIFIEMNDTLAVSIISLMQDRNAARLLGAIAEQDVNKAARLNRLMSQETGGTQ